jgi:hypothetical protein
MKKTNKGRTDRYELDGARSYGQQGEPSKYAVRVGHVAIATVAVADPAPDPNGGPGQRVLAAVNRRVDILEHERAHGRISDEAYFQGRIVQALFERGGLSGGSTWHDSPRVDAEVAKELAIIRRIAGARAVEGKIEQLRDVLGTTDAAIVRQVLGENRSYAEVTQTLDLRTAAAEQGGTGNFVPYGKGGKRAPSRREVAARRISYIAQRFRDALETLARETRRR